MIRIPKFKDDLRIDISPPDLLFFIQESGYQFVRAKLLCLLAPLIDGVRNVDQIAKELKREASPVDVQCGLWMLESEGFLTTENDHTPLLETNPVEILSVLEDHGIKVDFVVSAEDYLQEGLAEFNTKAIQLKYSWVPVKAVGNVLWLGPLFKPGGACWNCLALRLREKRRVDTFLKENPHQAIKSAMIRPADPRKFEPMARIFKKHSNTLVTLDLQTKKLEQHSVLQMEHCLFCRKVVSVRAELSGNSNRLPTSPSIRRLKGAMNRAATGKSATFAKYSYHISFRTGVVDHLETTNNGTIHSACADHIFVPTIRKKDLLRKGLTQKSWGKGITQLQAKTSALCEALERYSGVFRGNEVRVLKAFQEIEDQAISLNDCMNFSASQFANREEWNRSPIGHDWIPMPMDKKRKIEWSPVWSLTHNRQKYLPTAYCYYGYLLPANHRFCRADSNGNAAGNTREEAIVNGFLEVVERDCAALWWYNRAPRPAVDLESFRHPYLRKVRHYYEQNGRDLWVLDITSDFKIPCFAAISAWKHSHHIGYLLGLGAHLDAEMAVIHAITEMNQFFQNANLQKRALIPDFWLEPSQDAAQKSTDYRCLSADDSRDELSICMKIVEDRKMEMFVLDQTRTDVGLPVVKVMIPGMRQIWRRFGPGRLFDIPVQLGWIKKCLREKQLNQQRFLI